jgi:lipoprotein NlpI
MTERLKIHPCTLLLVLFSLLSLPAAGQTAGQFFDRAFERQKRWDLDGAIADYTRSIALDPRNAQAFNNRGEAKRQKGDLDGAIADYTLAIAIDPRHASASYNRGIARKRKGDLEGAIADYTQAIAINPKFAQAYNNRGFAKKQQGDLEGAIGDYTLAIAIDPKHAMACNNRGIAHYLNRSWTEALVDFQRKCELSPREADYPQLYIWILRRRLGEKTAADRELDHYLQVRPGSGENGWVEKVGAFLLDRLGEEEFLQAAAATEHPKEPGQQCSAWYFCGLKRLLAGERTAAAEHFQKCLATEEINETEYAFAAAELKALE